MNKPIKVAIASDLHAHNSDALHPSHLNITMAAVPATAHPIEALRELIQRERLTADMLLSPGDLGDKANPAAIVYAWNALHVLAQELNAKMCIGTAGNHDIDSRYQGSNFSPGHILRGLTPPFPLADEQLHDRYWARAYVILQFANCRLLVLNSSAFHGATPTEHNHGRIDSLTLSQIQRELDIQGHQNVNILLCHHHPHAHTEHQLGEDDVMKQGSLLLKLLDEGPYGSWLVVHGHKHHPKLTYASGSGSAPLVFGAGSLCATLYPDLQTVARNQFYLLEIHEDKYGDFGLVGRMRVWDWASGAGWVAASPRSGLPHQLGFGYRTNLTSIAQRVASSVGESELMRWADLVSQMPELDYLIPLDLKKVETILSQKGICFHHREDGVVDQIGRHI